MVVSKLYDYDSFQQSHLICLGWIPEGSRILEFGPATGYMTRFLRDELSCVVTGFEYSPEAATQAALFCERIIVGDIEDFSLWEPLSPPYDFVIFADVLEHLRDPQSVLARCYKLMSGDGRILISIPNIAHWTVRFGLLKGNFDYASCGLLDNTHLKFFTKKTLTEMIRSAGFVIADMQITRTDYPLDHQFSKARLMRVKHLLNRLFDKFFPDAIAFQMVVNCCRDLEFDGSTAVPAYETVLGR